MVINPALENKIQYFVISLTIVLSGSLIPFVFSNSYSLTLFVFLTFLVFLIPILQSGGFSEISFSYLLLLAIFLLGLLFYRGEFDKFQNYVGMMGRLLIAWLVTTLVCKNKFINIYTDVLVVYSAFSLVMYAIGLIFPDFIFSLPVSFNDAGTEYRHLYIYFYQGIDAWNFRNAGLFWEAGAFQVFVSLALLFEFFYLPTSRKSLIRKSILVVTIASTASTVGILVLAILFAVKVLTSRSLHSLVLLLAFGVSLFTLDIFNSLLWDKFNDENISGVDRISGQLADIKIFLSEPVTGVGFSEYIRFFETIAYSLGAFVPTSTNSFTGLLALNGLLYSLLLFLPMFSFFVFSRPKIGERFAMLAVFVLLLSSQGLFNQILFLSILFYGLGYDRPRKANYCMQRASDRHKGVMRHNPSAHTTAKAFFYCR